MITTLNKIREQSPCADGWEKLLRHLGKTQADDEPLSLITILDSNGLEDALWVLERCDETPRKQHARGFGVWCVRRVQHLMADFPCGVNVLDVAERYIAGDATYEELDAAEWAARAVARVAEEAAGAAEERATARLAAAVAARLAAAVAARAASGAAVAEWAAKAAAGYAERTVGGAERAAQEAEFRRRFA